LQVVVYAKNHFAQDATALAPTETVPSGVKVCLKLTVAAKLVAGGYASPQNDPKSCIAFEVDHDMLPEFLAAMAGGTPFEIRIPRSVVKRFSCKDGEFKFERGSQHLSLTLTPSLRYHVQLACLMVMRIHYPWISDEALLSVSSQTHDGSQGPIASAASKSPPQVLPTAVTPNTPPILPHEGLILMDLTQGTVITQVQSKALWAIYNKRLSPSDEPFVLWLQKRLSSEGADTVIKALNSGHTDLISILRNQVPPGVIE